QRKTLLDAGAQVDGRNVLVADQIVLAQLAHEIGAMVVAGDTLPLPVLATRRRSPAVYQDVRSTPLAPFGQSKLDLDAAVSQQLRNFTILLVQRQVVHAGTAITQPVAQQ